MLFDNTHLVPEKCSCCGQRYDTVYELPSFIWRRIASRQLLCPTCADSRARDKGIHLYWGALPDVYPLEMADRLSGALRHILDSLANGSHNIEHWVEHAQRVLYEYSQVRDEFPPDEVAEHPMHCRHWQKAAEPPDTKRCVLLLETNDFGDFYTEIGWYCHGTEQIVNRHQWHDIGDGPIEHDGSGQGWRVVAWCELEEPQEASDD